MSTSLVDRLFKRLRQLRVSRNLSQEEFAERASISYKYYQAIEAGRKRDLRLSTLEKLAKALGIGLNELLDPDEERFIKNAFAFGEAPTEYRVKPRQWRQRDEQG